MRRRDFLSVGAAIGMSTLAGCSFHTRRESRRAEGPQLGLGTVAEGFNQPLALRTTNDDSLFYVADRVGRVFVIDRRENDTSVFLDIADQLSELRGELGLAGIELHPDYERNRRFYVRYSAPPRASAPEGFLSTFVLSEFRARDGRIDTDPGSERKLLEIDWPGTRHAAGDIAFGPDGYLYVPIGDGAGYNVNPAEDWYHWNDIGQAGQDVNQNLMGSVLRIDVDGRDDGKPYAIPDDNPLVGEHGLDEHYAWGFRNPYRISFNGDRLFVADAGTDFMEEVSIVEKGGNYGWSVKEGTDCGDNVQIETALNRNPLNILRPKYWLAAWNEYSPYKLCPDRTNDDQPLIDPIIAYHREGGQAVIGGYVYAGDTLSDLQGRYVFADLSVGQAKSPVFAAHPSEDGQGLWTMERLQLEGAAGTGGNILSFGRDDAGELYALTTRFQEGTGAVRRLSPP